MYMAREKIAQILINVSINQINQMPKKKSTQLTYKPTVRYYCFAGSIRKTRHISPYRFFRKYLFLGRGVGVVVSTLNLVSTRSDSPLAMST